MNKTSFPKVQDKGEASASVVFSAQIKFSLFPDKDGSVEVKDVACGFKITSLDVKVLSGNLKMLYKMLVSVFQEKLTSSVESDLAVRSSELLARSAGCFLALGSGLRLVGTASARR